MPIVSYLAYPVQEHREQLLLDLQQHPHCEMVPSTNSDVFILVTDTSTEEEEKQTQEFLRGHKGLLCLAMVYGQLEHQTAEPIDLVQRLEEINRNTADSAESEWEEKRDVTNFSHS